MIKIEIKLNKKKYLQSKKKLSNFTELEKCIKKEWKVILKYLIKNLVDRMSEQI